MHIAVNTVYRVSMARENNIASVLFGKESIGLEKTAEIGLSSSIQSRRWIKWGANSYEHLAILKQRVLFTFFSIISKEDEIPWVDAFIL